MNTLEQPAPRVGMSVVGRSDVGRVRTSNEDAFLIADLSAAAPVAGTLLSATFEVGARGVLLAVADGMGGAQAGEVASALALRALRTGLSTIEARSAEAALVSCVEAANRAVWGASAFEGRDGMGATMTAVLIYGQRAYVAEVGDSRAYVLRGRRLVQLTHDQSFVQLLVDQGAITAAEAAESPQRNVVTQAIGTSPEVSVALSRFTLRRGDRLLLCSDGLTGHVGGRELESIVSTAGSLDAACDGLIELANARGGEDNVTVLVAEIGGDGVPAPGPDDRVSLDVVTAYDPAAASAQT